MLADPLNVGLVAADEGIGDDPCLDEVRDTGDGRVRGDVGSRPDRPEYFRGLELL